MPDPMTLLTSMVPVVVSDLYTRTITGMVNDQRWRLQQLQAVSLHIASAIDAQNQSHFQTAQLALDREDISEAITSLARGLPVDPSNAQGWMDYASLLTLIGKHDAAQKIWKQSIEWFGVDCPCLPPALREQLRPHDRVAIQSGKSIEKTVLSGLVSGKLANAAVSDAGVAAAFYHTTGYIRTKADIRLHFHPWSEDGKQINLFSVDKDPISYSNDVPTFSITAMTKRFVVINDQKIIDLENPAFVKITTPEKIHAAFGNNKPGVIPQVGGSIKGVYTALETYAVSHDIHSSTLGRYSYSTANNGPKLLARPEVFRTDG